MTGSRRALYGHTRQNGNEGSKRRRHINYGEFLYDHNTACGGSRPWLDNSPTVGIDVVAVDRTLPMRATLGLSDGSIC